MNMRFWLLALAEPNRIAAQVLTTSPMNVRTFGLMRESASQRTMVSSNTPQARPKAEVQEAAMKATSVTAKNTVRLCRRNSHHGIGAQPEGSEISAKRGASAIFPQF